jgi:hypothetical protein
MPTIWAEVDKPTRTNGMRTQLAWEIRQMNDAGLVALSRIHVQAHILIRLLCLSRLATVT